MIKLRYNGQEIQFVNLWYDFTLNSMSSFRVGISGNSNFSLFSVDSEIEIYRNGSLELKGIIKKIDRISGGTLVLTGNGYEKHLADEKCQDHVWKSTATSTILNTILGWSSRLTIGTIDSSGISTDYKTTSSQSIWNAITDIVRMIGQYIVIDYSTNTINILNSKGSSNITTLVDGVDTGEITYGEEMPKAKKVIVYGKGDGNTQIKATATSTSYTAGDPVRIISDPNIISQSQAQIRANKELSLAEENIKTYEFKVLNPFALEVETGDTLTLNSPQLNINDLLTVRSVRRGISGSEEFLNLNVANKEYIDKVTSLSVAKTVINSTTRMQGTTNVLTYDAIRNGNSSVPVDVYIPLPSSLIEDEVGNKRILSMTLDYDIDPYNRQYGSVSDPGHDHYSPTQTSSSYTLAGDFDTDYILGTTIFSTWTEIYSGTISGTFDFLYFDLWCEASGWSGTDTIGWKITIGGYDKSIDMGIGYNSGKGTFMRTYVVPVLSSSSSSTIKIYMYSAGGYTYDVEWHIYTSAKSHSHTIYGYDVDSASTGVTIGDSVSDASSVNATSITAELQYLDAGTWTTKYTKTISLASATYGTDIDMTDSGSYPDTAGLWRIRITTNSSSPDLVKAVVKVKHQMDN